MQGGGARRLGVTLLLVTIAILAFAGNSLFARAALVDGGIGAGAFSAIRLIAGALVLLPFVNGVPRGRDLPGGIALAAYAILFAFAYRSLTTASGALILFAGALALIGVVVALGGLGWLFAPGVGAPDAMGAFLMLGAGIAWGFYTLIGRAAASATQQVARSFVIGALIAAALLLLLENFGRSPAAQSASVQKTLGKVEWITIFFFVGLFVSVKGLEEVGLLAKLANNMLDLTGGDMTATALTVLWASAIVSSIIDNIPFVATMIPLIKSMAPTFGGSEQLLPLWWSLSLGACLGGNGSLVGASANLIVAGFAERSGHRIGFLKFMLAAFPLMILSIIIASVYIHLRYL